MMFVILDTQARLVAISGTLRGAREMRVADMVQAKFTIHEWEPEVTVFFGKPIPNSVNACMACGLPSGDAMYCSLAHVPDAFT